MNITDFTADPDLILQPKLTGRKNEPCTRGPPDSWLQTVFSWADVRLTGQDDWELVWPTCEVGRADLCMRSDSGASQRLRGNPHRQRARARPGVAASKPALWCVRVSIFYLDGKIIRMWCGRKKEQERITLLHKRIQCRPWPMRYLIWIHERLQRHVFTACFLPIFSHWFFIRVLGWNLLIICILSTGNL